MLYHYAASESEPYSPALGPCAEVEAPPFRRATPREQQRREGEENGLHRGVVGGAKWRVERDVYVCVWKRVMG